MRKLLEERTHQAGRTLKRSQCPLTPARLAAWHRHRRTTRDHQVAEYSPIRTDRNCHDVGAVRQPYILSVVVVSWPSHHTVHSHDLRQVSRLPGHLVGYAKRGRHVVDHHAGVVARDMRLQVMVHHHALVHAWRHHHG